MITSLQRTMQPLVMVANLVEGDEISTNLRKGTKEVSTLWGGEQKSPNSIWIRRAYKCMNWLVVWRCDHFEIFICKRQNSYLGIKLMQSVSQQGNALLILYFTGQLFSTCRRHQTPLHNAFQKLDSFIPWPLCDPTYCSQSALSPNIPSDAVRPNIIIHHASPRPSQFVSRYLISAEGQCCYLWVTEVPLSRSCMNNFVILRLREVQYVATSINARMWSTDWKYLRVRQQRRPAPEV